MNTLWHRLAQYWRGNRMQMLEEEVARLREENRALVNSILGLAGIPPMRIAASVGARHSAGEQHEMRPSSIAFASAEGQSQIVPLRRRSWQQAGRVREIVDARAARRERETDTEAFPAPRNIVVRA